MYFIAFFLIVGCTTSSQQRKSQPKEASPSVVKDFQRAQKLYQSGKDKDAVSSLIQLVKSSPSSDITDDAYFLLGDIYYRHKKYRDAYTAYSNVINGSNYSSLYDSAKIKAAYCLAFLKKDEKSYSLINDVLKTGNLNKNDRVSAQRLQAELTRKFGTPLEQVFAYYDLSQLIDNPTLKKKYELKSMAAVESQLDEKDLHVIAGKKSLGSLRVIAQFRLGLFYFEQGEHSQAEDFLSSAVHGDPEGAYGERAAELISQIRARKRVDRYTIGAILPLSGKNEAYGYKALKGLQLALDIYNKKNSTRFKLAVIDSEGKPSVARRAVERLVVEDHVIAIVGSLLSRTATAVAAKAQELRVPNIALSQKHGITDIGDFIFRNALTSRMQVEFLVKAAIQERGFKRFAILYPNDRYGVEFANLFWDEVLSQGAEVVGAQAYEPSETDFRNHVRRLIGTFYTEDRITEYKKALVEWKTKHPHLSARKQPPKDLLKPVVSFDALFIPDSVKALGQIAPMMAFNDVEGTPLLGTNLWNTPGLIKRAGKYLKNPLFVDSFLTSNSQFRNSNFKKKFTQLFGDSPHIIELQAYDSGLLLRKLLASGVSSRDELRNKLIATKTFQGALGELEMNETREIVRPLTALTVSEGQIKKLESQKTAKSL